MGGRCTFQVGLFDRWYGLFAETVDESWSGPIAEAAKDHAARVAKVLARRLLGVDWDPTVTGRSAG